MKKTVLASYAVCISMIFANISAIKATTKAIEAFRIETPSPTNAVSSSQTTTELKELANLSEQLEILSQKVQKLERSQQSTPVSDDTPNLTTLYSPREVSAKKSQDNSELLAAPLPNSRMQVSEENCELQSQSTLDIRILSLDGGGIRGLLELEFLAYLEQRTGKHTTEIFDIIGGTSVGGQIAILLSINDPKTGKPKYTAKELLETLLAKFPTAFETKGTTLFGLLGEKYKTTPIKKMLQDLSGNMKFHESIIPTVATAYDLSRDTEKRLKVFSSIDKKDVTALDVMLATAAAPSYFKSHKVNGREYADGGLISNNPTMVTLNEAQRIFPQASNYIIVSLGTGFFQDVKPDLVSLKHVSPLSLARNIPTLFLEGQKDALEESQINRPDVIRFRFNPSIKGKKIDLDDASEENIARLRFAAFDMIGTEQKKISLLISSLITS